MKSLEYQHGPPEMLSITSSCDLENRLVRIWCEVLDIPEVDVDDNFFELGGDSLSAVELAVRLRQLTGDNVPVSIIYQAPTIQELADWLDDGTKCNHAPRLIDLNSNKDAAECEQRSFFCVHGVGGEVTSLAALAQSVGPARPFVGIAAAPDVPAAQRSIVSMAADYVTLIRDRQPDGPYCIGGYSLGGSIAYEMACQLHTQGEKVALLAILDHCPPPIRYRPIRWTPTTFARILTNAPRWIWDNVITRRHGWRRMWRRIRKSLKHDACPTDASRVFDVDRLPTLFRTTIELNYQRLRAYEPRPYAGRLTLFRARTQGRYAAHSRDLGWGELAPDGLEIVPVPGAHDTMLNSPHVATLGQALAGRLDFVKSKRTPVEIR